MKSAFKRLVREDHWLYLSWYRQHFGAPAALRAYARMAGGDGLASAPNPLAGGRVFLRPGTTDQNVYDEIFIDGEYALELGDPALIVDAGAHVGLASVYFASRYPRARVIALEPEPGNFAVLQRNARAHPNITPLNVGLWSHRAGLRIEPVDDATWSFRVREDAGGAGIPALGLHDVMREAGAARIDVLKMDIEGSEVEVLGTQPPWVGQVGTLIVELHDRFRPGCTQALDEALRGWDHVRARSGESWVVSALSPRAGFSAAPAAAGTAPRSGRR